VQISALGAGAQPGSRFLATKDAADRHLLRIARDDLLPGWCVLRPSLVIGRGGASTALFCALAAFIRPVRLGPGTWRTQPIHVADLVRIVAAVIEVPALRPGLDGVASDAVGGGAVVLDVVGPEPMTTDELVVALRGWLSLPPRPFVMLPLTLMRIAARVGALLPNAPLTGESLTMVARGNTADVSGLAKTLGCTPRRLADALAAEPSVPADLWFARMLPVRAVLTVALVVVWVGASIASFAIPSERAQVLLSGLGLNRSTAMAVTWSGAALDPRAGAGHAASPLATAGPVWAAWRHAAVHAARKRGASGAVGGSIRQSGQEFRRDGRHFGIAGGRGLMPVYQWVLWVHILSSTLLFGTGLGTAFHGWMAQRSEDLRAIVVVSRNVVIADWLFAAPAVVVSR
jgi:hypothetical protein